MQITGTMVYYSRVCGRKLWYFAHEIQMEHENELVTLGRLLDENSYQRDEKHVNIDNVINIDFIRSRNILHEVKKSRKIEEAGILQVKYYLYYLKKRDVRGITGKIDYPLLKQSDTVELTAEDEAMVERVLEEIRETISQELPPERRKSGICKSCSYNDLCYI